VAAGLFMTFSKPKLKKLLKLLGPFLFIFLFFRVVDTETTVRVLKGIRPDMLVVSVLLFPIVNAALALRWWLICRRLAIDASFKGLFQVYYIAWFLSVLPLVGVSPLAKLLYLNEEKKPAGTSAVSIALDKLFDIIGLLVFGLFGLVYFPQNLANKTEIFFVIGGCLVAMIILWAFKGRIWPVLMVYFKRYTTKRLQKIGSSLNTDLKEFWSGFNVRFFLLILGVSITIGVLRAFVLYVLAVSLHISVSFGLCIACRAIIGLVNVIPVTISGLGTRDAVLLLMLPLGGVSKEAAIALGLAAFLWTIGSKFSGVFFWLNHPLPSKSFRNIKVGK
jgi:hypothetical protein